MLSCGSAQATTELERAYAKRAKELKAMTEAWMPSGLGMDGLIRVPFLKVRNRT